VAKTNPEIREPKPPGFWVDYEACICGETYAAFRVFPVGGYRGARFSEGCDAIRRQAGGYDAGGGYRSRRAVLWAMRVIKLTAWFDEHSGCEGKAYGLGIVAPAPLDMQALADDTIEYLDSSRV
jgi:hypothetical protein